jgi:hypothetical protein
MPVFSDTTTMENHRIGGSGFGFSAKRIGDLGASEYTLVVIAADATGSVYGFKDKIEETVKAVVRSCRYSPRADNLMLRFVTFNASSGVHEVHGFKPLAECNEDAYTGTVIPGGNTNLFDAGFSAAGSLNQYGKELTEQDFGVNGLFVVITDGDDNASRSTPSMLRAEIQKGVTGECLESVVSILVGVNVQDSRMSQRLQAFQAEAGFTQYIEVDNVNDKAFAKLADFVSKSISAASQALGTGGPSQALTF